MHTFPMAFEFLKRKNLPPVDETFKNHRHELARFAHEFVDLYYDHLAQRTITKDLEKIYLDSCNTITNHALPIDQADARKRLLGLLKAFWDAKDFATYQYNDARDSVHEAFGEANAGYGGAEELDAIKRDGNKAFRAIQGSERPLFGLDQKLAALSDRFSADRDIATRPEDRYAFIEQEFPHLSDDLREAQGQDIVSLAETCARLVKRERATYPHQPAAWKYLDEHLTTLLHIYLEPVEALIQQTDLDDVYKRVSADDAVRETRIHKTIETERKQIANELDRDRFAVMAYQALRICANTAPNEERRHELVANLDRAFPVQVAEQIVTYMGSLPARDIRDLLTATHRSRFHEIVQRMTDDIKRMEAEHASDTETVAGWQAKADRLKNEIREEEGDQTGFVERDPHRLIGTRDAKTLTEGLDFIQNIWNRIDVAYTEVQDTREPTVQELVEYLALERMPRLEQELHDTEQRVRGTYTAERDLIIKTLPSARALLNEGARWHAALRELRTQLGGTLTDAIGKRSDNIVHEWFRKRREHTYQHDPSEPMSGAAS